MGLLVIILATMFIYPSLSDLIDSLDEIESRNIKKEKGVINSFNYRFYKLGEKLTKTK